MSGMEGGRVDDLPVHSLMGCPTEIPMADRREKELSDLGFVPLFYGNGNSCAVFVSLQSASKPRNYDTDFANVAARRGAQIPYIMAVSRFAHYLKAIVRDLNGSFMSCRDAEVFLNRWITQYVSWRDDASPEAKARGPLREARIDVSEIPGKPGRHKAVAFLQPHFQLDTLPYALRIVVELPGAAR